jgi:hypothetical protein
MANAGALPPSADERIAVLVRHRDVAHDQVRRRAEELPERLRGGPRCRDPRAAALQRGHDQLAGVALVLHHQDPQAAQLRRERHVERRSAAPGGEAFGRLGRARQPHGERCALPLAVAVRAHRPAVQLDELADDGEPQPQPSLAARAAATGLAEPLEDVRQELGGDPLPVVADDHLDPAAVAAQEQLDVAALRRELDRISEQVAQHLREPVGIARHRRLRLDLRAEGEAALLGDWTHRLHHALGQGRQLDRGKLQRKLAGDDPRDVEQILDELHLDPRVALHGLQGALALLGRELAAAQEPHPSQHRVQRRAQLVRHGGDELVLEPARQLRGAVQARVVQRHRGATSDLLHQRQVRGGEAAAGAGVGEQCEHADLVPAREQRRADPGADRGRLRRVDLQG